MNRNVALKVKQKLHFILLLAYCIAASNCSENDDWIDKLKPLDGEEYIEWEGEVYKITYMKLVREELKGKKGKFEKVRGWFDYNDSTKTWTMLGETGGIVDYDHSWSECYIVTSFADESFKEGGNILISGTYEYDYSIKNVVEYIGSRLSFLPGRDFYKVTITDVEAVKE